MNALYDSTIAPAAFGPPPRVSDDAQGPSFSDVRIRPRHRARTAAQSENLDRRSERWGRLMIAAHAGERRAYEQLLRELDLWLRRYYARRPPRPAAEDATQEALLAVHAQRQTYAPSRSFGPWVTAIARRKWIDRVRDASQFIALSSENEIPTEDHGDAAISAAALDDLLGRLTPTQASVIRLVKLRGLSIASASGATGQFAALVKINIYRDLKTMAAMVGWRPIAATP